MEGRGDRQQHRPLGAARLGDFDRALDRELVARQHNLAAAIVIGGGADAGAFRLGRDRLHVAELEPDQRRHGARADRNRLLHGEPAHAQQPRRVGDRERARRGKRRIFAERMSGDKGRVAREIDAGFVFQHAHRGERHRHQRRLRVFRQRQRVARAVPNDVAEPLAERRVDFLEDRPRARKRVGERLAHADGLAALTGENKRRSHRLRAAPLKWSPLRKGRKIPRVPRSQGIAAKRCPSNKATTAH